jgi:hypothetical protein
MPNVDNQNDLQAVLVNLFASTRSKLHRFSNESPDIAILLNKLELKLFRAVKISLQQCRKNSKKYIIVFSKAGVYLIEETLRC